MACAGNFSRRNFLGIALGGLILPSANAHTERTHLVDLQTVCGRMVAMDNWRSRSLLGYSVKRRYSLRHGESPDAAEMLVSVQYTYPGYKSFEVISEKNCGFLQERIFRRVMNAEIQAARDDKRDSTRILPRNYDFEVLGMEAIADRPAYVLRMKPKRKHRFLVDGKIWVDQQDAAVVRIDGVIDTSSFWVRSFHMLQNYEKVGAYWLVASNQNEASVRLLGEASLDIQYFDYQIRSV